MTATISQRKLAPDLARGAMLLLIAMAYAKVYASPEQTRLDAIARFATTLLLDNRAFPMFAILYGYGLAWMVARQRRAGKEEKEIRRLLNRRSAWLLVFGLTHAVLVFSGEILGSYGLVGLALGWLLFRPDRTLTKAVIVLSAVYLVVVTAASFALTGTGSAPVAGYTTPQDWLMRLAGLVSPIFIAVAWPLFLLVVLGFVAGRKGLLDDPREHLPTLRKIAVGGIAISVLGALPLALDHDNGLFMTVQVFTGVFGGAGYAAAFALLALKVDEHRGPLVRSVAAVGQRSLTFYLYDSILVAVALHPDLLGLRVGRAGALAVAATIWLSAVVWAAWVDRLGKPGPADAFLRNLVYR